MQQNPDDNGWQDFIAKCAEFKNLEDLEIFFNVFLTMSEKDELGKRFNIVRTLLMTNKPQREIAKDLKVSIANVSRGSNEIKKYSSDLKQVLKF